MALHIYCQSSRHNKYTNGNGYVYPAKLPVPETCPACEDPFIDKELYSLDTVAKGIASAMRSKQNPSTDNNGEIVLEWMHFTDTELIEIIQRDKHRDVIKAALAAQLLDLRSVVRPLGDFDWKDPNKLVNAAWVAGGINCAIKWIDYWCRGYDPMSIRERRSN